VDPAARWAGIREFTRAVARGAQAGIGGLYTAAEMNLLSLDADDLVASHVFFYPAVDPEVLPLLEFPATIDFGTRTLTEQTWHVRERPLIFSGQGSVWRAQFEIRRSDEAPRPGGGSVADDMILRPLE